MRRAAAVFALLLWGARMPNAAPRYRARGGETRGGAVAAREAARAARPKVMEPRRESARQTASRNGIPAAASQPPHDRRVATEYRPAAAAPAPAPEPPARSVQEEFLERIAREHERRRRAPEAGEPRAEPPRRIEGELGSPEESGAPAPARTPAADPALPLADSD